MIKKYTVLSFYSGESALFSLIDEVNQKIQEGWQPLGGICYNPHYGKHEDVYLQAMVLKNAN